MAADQPQWGQAWSRNMVSAEKDLPDSFDPGDLVDDVIRRVLVRPCGPQMMPVDHLEDRVGAHEIVRPYRHAGAVHFRAGHRSQ